MVLTIFVIVFFTGIFLYAIGKAIVSESNNIEDKKRTLKIKKEEETKARADAESKIETLTKEILELKELSKAKSIEMETLSNEILGLKELSKAKFTYEKATTKDVTTELVERKRQTRTSNDLTEITMKFKPFHDLESAPKLEFTFFDVSGEDLLSNIEQTEDNISTIIRNTQNHQIYKAFFNNKTLYVFVLHSSNIQKVGHDDLAIFEENNKINESQ